MKKNNIHISIIAALVLSIGLFSCADAPKKEAKEDLAEEVITEEVETMEEDDDYSFMLPSPIQIAAMFSQAGLDFESELVNPVGNISNYNTKTAKFLNFGVYSADLAYSVLNEQQQLSIEYLNSVKTLADGIGMPSIFGSGTLINSFEKNIDNQDSILRILTTVKRKTDEYLLENSDESKEAVFFAGAWVEGMYIGANASSANTHVSARLIEQMSIVENIIKGLEFQNDATFELDEIIADLTKLDITFNSFESVKALDLDEVDMEHMKLTDTELTELTNQISALRTKIING
jgi:hypothetical protein